MPTSKPRITVTLSKEQHATLRQISAAGGQSMSSIVSELLLVLHPTLKRTAATVQQLKQDRDADHQMVARMLSELHAERERKDGFALSRASPSVSPGPAQHSIPAVATEPDAIQFRASVDFVRKDSDRETKSLLDDIDLEPRSAKQKRTPVRSNSPAASSSFKGTPKRAKK